MENGLWNGQLLIATEISKLYDTEKEVRKASGRKELQCPDPDCQHPILRYCHGEIKDAFFAHLNNEGCDYGDFDNGNTQIMRTIRRILYEHFRENGYQVRLEVKVLDHHYTHLLFDMADGSKIAVEIGTKQLSANRIDYLTEEYQKKNIAVKWIVIGETNHSVREDRTYFLKRYLLNESQNKDLLVISWNGSEIAQYKCDSKKYEYNGRSILSGNYPPVFDYFSSIDELAFVGNELTLTGFAERYESWLDKKQSAFEKRIAQLEEEKRRHLEEEAHQMRERERLYRERQEWIKGIQQTATENLAVLGDNNKRQETSEPAKNLKNLNDKHRAEVIALMDQQQTQVIDSSGNRWIKCEKCGLIDTDDKFASYGGQNHINLGSCYNCSGIKRPI